MFLSWRWRSVLFILFVTICTVTWGLEYGPPGDLKAPINTFPRSLISGGPTNPYQDAQDALALPQMAMFENASFEVMEDIKDGLRYIFQTKNEWTLALTGHGHIAIDAVLDNILEPGDIILVLVQGLWGKRISDSSQRLGAIVKNIEKPLGATFTLEEIENGIREHKPRVVYLVNGESSSGVHQRVEGVGDLCRKYDCLLVVDLVTTMGILPFHFDKWKVDAAFCNNHKGIAAPVGLAPISFGPRAVAKILNRKTKPMTTRTDMKEWVKTNYWNIDKSRTQIGHHSFPVLLFYGLREALKILASETLEVTWARHENATNRFYDGIKGLNLEYYVPNPEDRLIGTVFLHPPTGMCPSDMASYIREKHGMDLGLGLGPTYGKVLRIAFLGPNANSEVVDTVLQALKDTIAHFTVGG